MGSPHREPQAARTFSVSLSSLKPYLKKADHGESLAPNNKSPGSAPKLEEKATKLLEADLESTERPFWPPSKSVATTYTPSRGSG